MSGRPAFTPLPALRCLALMVGPPWTARTFELCVSEDVRPEGIGMALLQAYPGFKHVPEIKVTDLGRAGCSFGGHRHYLIERVS